MKELSIYVLAGYPEFESLPVLLKELSKSGVKTIEIGIPFSDPLADGPVIIEKTSRSISNGMTMNHIFEQIRQCRSQVASELVLMGYLNSLLAYGIDAFCNECRA